MNSIKSKFFLLMVLFGVIYFYSNKGDESVEPELGEARRACIPPDVKAVTPLNFGSIVGSPSKQRFITLDVTDGSVNQSAFSYVGQQNFRSAHALDRTNRLGELAVSSTTLKVGSKLILEFSSGEVNGAVLEYVTPQVRSLIGMSVDQAMSYGSRVIFDVNSKVATARVAYGGKLTVSAGSFGDIRANVPVTITWECE